MLPKARAGGFADNGFYPLTVRHTSPNVRIFSAIATHNSPDFTFSESVSDRLSGRPASVTSLKRRRYAQFPDTVRLRNR